MTAAPHGTYRRYGGTGRCRCTPCQKANRAYQNLRVRLIAYGQWQPFADAEPVRQHVRSLMAAGISWRQVAHFANVSHSTVNRLLYVDPPVQRLRTQSAARLLQVHATWEHVGDAVPVDATGTRRRLQALMSVGWSQTAIAAHLGIHQTGVGRMFVVDRVLARRARAVRDLYDRLWNQAPPETTVQERAAVSRARRFAAANGWAPPMGWNDEEIDNPDARPDGFGVAESHRGVLPDTDELLWLMALGETDEAIAARFGASVKAVRQARYRATKKEAVAA